MIEYVRSVPLHRWLRRIAIGLALLAVPHIAIVMATDMATAVVNAHMFATVSLFILAKLESQAQAQERQAQARRDSARAIEVLTDAARR